jgi:hypothetical protein
LFLELVGQSENVKRKPIPKKSQKLLQMKQKIAQYFLKIDIHFFKKNLFV